MERKTVSYEVKESCAGITVGQFLKREVQLTKAQIRTLKFRENGITVDGVRVRVDRELAAGEVLQLALSDGRNQSDQLIPAGELPVILYEDEDVVCADKPSGLVVHPSHGHYQDSLSNQMRAYFLEKGTDVQIRSIGRLDKDTAGVVVFAKNQIAAARLWQQKDLGSFQKEYLAWCQGVFPERDRREEQKIEVPIGPAPGELMKMQADVQGLPAVTYYQVIRQEQNRALVRLHLETGRTHQIRVHMAYMGHPLCGDPIYGEGRLGETHAMLWARKARFWQPFTGDVMEVCSRQDSFLSFSAQ